MIIPLLQQVVQADAIGIFLLALLIAPFVIPKLIKNAKISEAEEIKKNNPEGVHKTIGHIFGALSYEEAKRIVNNKSEIISIQSQYEKEQRKKDEEKRIAERANFLRKECPDVTKSYNDQYIVNNENKLRREQSHYNTRKSQAESILKDNPEGALSVCGHISRYSMSEDDINNLINNMVKIIFAQAKINENKANLEKFESQLHELTQKFPLGVKAVLREKNWSTSNAEDVKLLLLTPGDIAEKQIREEEAIINSNSRIENIITKYSATSNWDAAKSRIQKFYGQRVTSVIELIIKAEANFKTISSYIDTIEQEQNDFAQETRNMSTKHFPRWGNYKYTFNNTVSDKFGRAKTIKLTTWQFFYNSCCFDDSVSYEYYPSIKESRIYKSRLESGWIYGEQVWSKIMTFLSQMREKYHEQLYVILANTDKLPVRSFDNNISYLETKLCEEGISYGFNVSNIGNKCDDKKCVIIDIITENKNLVRLCEDLFASRYGKDVSTIQGTTGIVYITLLKCFDRFEIEDLNQKEIKKQEDKIRKAQEEEERKKQEQARRIKDEQDISKAKQIAINYPLGFELYHPGLSTISLTATKAREIISNESSIKNHEWMVSRLRNSVSGWYNIADIPLYFFYYYYPTRFTNVSSDSQEARKLVFNFKDGVAHDRIKELVEGKLRSTFTSSELSQMTFVCIPASTRSVNQFRYQKFSSEICHDLDMNNGYNYITITREKTPSHLGGSDSAEYAFDRNFFKGKLVVLFDDIVTRGISVASMKADLESMNATVICAISIGRTFSDWNGNQPKPHPYTGRI